MNPADVLTPDALLPQFSWDVPSLAVLVSGGLDSAILLGEAVRHCASVQPLYVRCDLHWETVEQKHLRRFLDAVYCPGLRPLHTLHVPADDLYDDHWSITGAGVPGAETDDEAVFLPGRNVLLLAKAMLWCHLHNVSTLALAPLDSNPFPDATPAFFAAFESVVNQSVDGTVKICRPYAGLKKTDVLRRGLGLPLELTLSCIRPVAGKHCGRCNKCAERRRAFAEAGIPDPTDYHENRG